MTCAVYLNSALQPAGYEWGYEEVRSTADKRCKRCAGMGYYTPTEICNCVFRNVFEACLRVFEIGNRDVGAVVREGITCSRPTEEFAADFVVVGLRALHTRPLLREVFEMYIVNGHDAEHCTRRLNLTPSVFFRRFFQIKQELGRAYREVRPYPLYPPYEYFAKGDSAIRASQRVYRKLMELGTDAAADPLLLCDEYQWTEDEAA